MRPSQGNRRGGRRNGGGHSHGGHSSHGGHGGHSSNRSSGSSSSSAPRSAMSLRNQIFDSNGPDIRVRGNAFQVHEKYLALAKDTLSSGDRDRVLAENYLQHAEHYFRIIEAINEATAAEQRQRQAQYGDQAQQPGMQPPPGNGFYGNVGEQQQQPMQQGQGQQQYQDQGQQGQGQAQAQYQQGGRNQQVNHQDQQQQGQGQQGHEQAQVRSMRGPVSMDNVPMDNGNEGGNEDMGGEQAAVVGRR